MVTPLDTKLGDAVLSIARRIGGATTATFVVDPNEYDPVAGGLLDQEEATEVTVQALPLSQLVVEGGDDTVTTKAARLLIPAAADRTLTPTVGQVVRVGSDTFRVLKVEPVYSGEQVALWKLEIGQGSA
jgi:hypothetical protein